MKELELEAEEYISDMDAEFYKDGISDYHIQQLAKKDFIAGATSNAAKEYWKKQLEKEKLEFAINQLKQHTVHNVIPYVNRIDVINKIQKLQQKLNELNL